MDGRDWRPAAAWAGALGLLCLTAWLAGFNPFSAGTWAHWDSNYESIARGRYDLHRCAPTEYGGGDTWCGNAAWLPGYPLLMATVHAMGVSLGWAGVSVSWLLALATLVLLWRTFLRNMPPVAAAVGLVFAAVAPGRLPVRGVPTIAVLVSRLPRPLQAAAICAAAAIAVPIAWLYFQNRLV